jgi:hypothetical protein
MGRRRPWGSVRSLPSGRYHARLRDGSAAPDTFTTKAEASRWLSLAEAYTWTGAVRRGDHEVARFRQTTSP